ncbi:MAG: hypothetical protein QXF24_07790 [Thermoproteota archaeon]
MKPLKLLDLHYQRALKPCRLWKTKTVLLLSRSERDLFLQDEEKTERLLALELALCEEPSIVGYGGHLHVVGRKRDREARELGKH